MSDTDSLDGLIDDIDMDSLMDTKPSGSDSTTSTHTHTVASNNVEKKITKEEDLDDLLDDFFADDEETEAVAKKETRSVDASDEIDDYDDGDLSSHLKQQKIQHLEKALHTIPGKDMKKKWIDILSGDVKIDKTSTKFKRSYSYLEWQDTVEHFAADKSLRNLILRACSKSNMSDAQAKALQDKLFHDPELLRKYCKEFIKETSADIKNDKDFCEAKYPALWKAVE